MTGLIYLAGPIDGVTDDAPEQWRSLVAQSLAYLHCGSFHPQRAYTFPDSPGSVAAEVDKINREAIKRSYGVVANLTGEGRAIGTVREIEFARSMNKPVLVFILRDMPPTVALHDLRQVILPSTFWSDPAGLGEILREWLEDRHGSSVTTSGNTTQFMWHNTNLRPGGESNSG